LRADVAELFENILKEQEKKISFLQKLHDLECSLKHYILISDEDEIANIISSEDYLIECIDECDFYISSHIDKVLRITGVNPTKIVLDNYLQREPLLRNFKDNLSIIETLVKDIYNLKSENINKMQLLSSEAIQYADELDKIEKIKKRLIIL